MASANHQPPHVTARRPPLCPPTSAVWPLPFTTPPLPKHRCAGWTAAQSGARCWCLSARTGGWSSGQLRRASSTQTSCGCAASRTASVAARCPSFTGKRWRRGSARQEARRLQRGQRRRQRARGALRPGWQRRGWRGRSRRGVRRAQSKHSAPSSRRLRRNSHSSQASSRRSTSGTAARQQLRQWLPLLPPQPPRPWPSGMRSSAAPQAGCLSTSAPETGAFTSLVRLVAVLIGGVCFASPRARTPCCPQRRAFLCVWHSSKSPCPHSHYPSGTEDGWIHKCSTSYSEQYLESYHGHLAAVTALAWCPLRPDLFLSASADASLRLWQEGRPGGSLLAFQASACGPWGSRRPRGREADRCARVYPTASHTPQQLGSASWKHFPAMNSAAPSGQRGRGAGCRLAARERHSFWRRHRWRAP
jgi:hypothetical protein